MYVCVFVFVCVSVCLCVCLHIWNVPIFMYIYRYIEEVLIIMHI